MASSDIANYPPLQVLFQSGSSSVTVNLSPAQYLTSNLCSPGSYMINIYPSKHSGTQIIFGDAFMQQFTWIFDVANNRIGVAEASGCPNSQILNPSQYPSEQPLHNSAQHQSSNHHSSINHNSASVHNQNSASTHINHNSASVHNQNSASTHINHNSASVHQNSSSGVQASLFLLLSALFFVAFF